MQVRNVCESRGRRERRGDRLALAVPAGLAGLAVVTVAAVAVAIGGPASAAVRVSATIQQIATSPSTSVVAVAPLAVSVTFDRPPAPDGLSLQILGPDGDVSSGQPQVVGNAIRRTMDKDVPGGRFTARWKARGSGGDTLSGSFGFIAARGNGSYADEPARPTGDPSAAPHVSVPVSPAPADPVTSTGPVVVSGGAAGGSGTSSGEATGSLPGELKLVPIALGALLVLASAGVGMLGSARRGKAGRGRSQRANLFVRGGLALPWHRHQS